MEIRKITAQDCYEIRHDILCHGLPIETCYFKEDFDENTFHLGAFSDDKLVSIASFCEKKSENFDDGVQYQLRGLATLPEYRGMHAATDLIEYAQDIVRHRGCTILWCNARVSVGQYYHKIGFEAIGDVFTIDPVGPHTVMYKKLI